MNITNTSNKDYTYTGYFEGRPCKVIEEHHIILPDWSEMSFNESMDFIKSREFWALQNAGIEIHGGAYS